MRQMCFRIGPRSRRYCQEVKGGRWVFLPAVRLNATSLSGYDAMHRGFRKTELSSNDSYTITLPMQLSLSRSTIIRGRPVLSASYFARRVGRQTVFLRVRPGSGISIFLRDFAWSCAP